MFRLVRRIILANKQTVVEKSIYLDGVFIGKIKHDIKASIIEVKMQACRLGMANLKKGYYLDDCIHALSDGTMSLHSRREVN